MVIFPDAIDLGFTLNNDVEAVACGVLGDKDFPCLDTLLRDKITEILQLTVCHSIE